MEHGGDDRCLSRISEYTNNPSPDFDKWVNLLPSSEGVTIGGTDNADLTVSIKTSAYALAFYKNNAPPLVIEHVPPHLTQALYGPDGSSWLRETNRGHHSRNSDRRGRGRKECEVDIVL